MIKINNTDISDIKINDSSVSKVMLAGDIVWPADDADYVEIGGVKWATINIGANDITDYGQYFQWGDVQGYSASQVGNGNGKKNFNWQNYKYATDVNYISATMTKYNSADGKTSLDDSDDAAMANLESGWRMPTKTDFDNLRLAVNTQWTNNYQNSGVAGLICTSRTDSSKVLFFPAAGMAYSDAVYDKNDVCYYWSSTLSSEDDTFAYMSYFSNGSNSWNTEQRRSSGNAIRPVRV